MEVHHPHHPTHKKKIGEYLLEFFMLFFAVTLGFFAENIREEITSKEREHKFMASFVSDLASDTVVINRQLPVNKARVMAIDSIFEYYASHPITNTIPCWLYKRMNRASWGSRYLRNASTLNQLQNSGGQIIIHNKDVADSIAKFNYSWERSSYYYNTYTEYQNRLFIYQEKMFKSKKLLPYYINGSGYSDYVKLPDSIMLDIDPSEIDEYLNFLSRQKWTTQQDDSTHMRIKKKTIQMIHYIKNEYHLDSESH